MKLKSYHILIGILLCVIGCDALKKPKTFQLDKDANATYDTIEIVNESLEYEIIIIEVGFNAWLTTQRPRGFYSQNYLENRNQFYVREYNSRHSEPQRFNPDLYPLRIDYFSDVDYGYEVNYLLYHYFLFFQQRYDQNLGYFQSNTGQP
jgi:hypothetical protein